VAGDGKPASAGDGGPALAAGFSPYGVATDRRGDIVIVDNSGNYQIPGNRIKIVPAHAGIMFGIAMKAGHIYTVAGDGNNAGPIASAVPATHSSLDPFGAAVDGAGNLVLAADQRVRVVAARPGRFYGIQMKAGYIYTIAGPFPGSQSVAVDGHGNVEVLDTVESVVGLIAVRSGTFYGQQVTAGHVYVSPGTTGAARTSARAARRRWRGWRTRRRSGRAAADRRVRRPADPGRHAVTAATTAPAGRTPAGRTPAGRTPTGVNFHSRERCSSERRFTGGAGGRGWRVSR
jgi:hypothetical protein